MNIQGLIERYEKFKASKKKLTSVDLVLKDLRSLDEPEPLPFKLKDVVRRIRGFDPTTQTRWLNDILKELGDDYGSMKYREGYEQGKFEGAWVGNQLKDADKIRRELNQVKVPQFVAGWIKYCKFTGVNLYHALEMGDLYFYNYANQKDDLKLKEFFETDTNQDVFARAWLDGYEVEEEKRYRISMPKARNHKNHAQILCEIDGSIFWCGEWYPFRTKFTRKELEEAGFGWVFDCPGIEIEEVE